MAGIQIPYQANENDNEPPFVLQNVSAMSRQVAKPKRRGWGVGWFQGGNNNNNNDSDDKSKNNKVEQEKIRLGDASQAAKNILPQQNEVDSSLRQQSSSLSSSSSTQSETPSNNPLHPQSPKSLSPQISSSKKASVSGEITNKRSITNKNNNNNTDYSHHQNASSTTAEKELLFERKMREKRRRKIFLRIEWYEEDLQERVSRDGIHLLTEDDVIALGLFNAQRLGEEELGDVELNQLIVLADTCKQAQKDEAELEMLLEREEAGDEVDMDRVYHLELLSRRRMGEKLTDEENGELQLLEQKEQNENGNDNVDDIRLYEPSLLDKKRKGVKHTTDEKLRQEELVKLRCEDARVNKKDFNKLLQLKEKGEYVDRDRLHLLNLLDRKRCDMELSEEESDTVDKYFALRDEEHIDNINLSMLLGKRDSGEGNDLDAERISELILLKRKRKGEILNKEEDHQLSEIGNSQYNGKESTKDEIEGSEDATFNEEEFDELLSRKERGEKLDENRLYELELLYRRRRKEELTEDELMDLKLFQLQRAENGNNTLDNSKEDEEVNSVSTIGEWSFSPSELLGLDDIQRELKKEGLPLKFSFTPFSEENEYEMSVVSSGDESYVQDLVNQRKNREDNRKEECLEDAYKLYKRTIKKKKLPENEEMLLALFENVLKKKNDKMRKKDKEFDELVDKVVAQHELNKQDGQEIAQLKKEILDNEEEIDIDKTRVSTEGSQKIKGAGGMQEVDDLGNENGHKIAHSDAEEETIGTAQVNHPLSDTTEKLVDSNTLDHEICHAEEIDNKPQEIAKGFGFFRFVAKGKENTTNDDERKSSQSKEHAVEGSIDEELNAHVNQENKATVSEISFAKDDDDLYEKTAVVVDISRTTEMDFVEEKKNSEEPTQDIFDINKCGTEFTSKDVEHGYVSPTIDSVDNDIQYNKFMERLHNGKSLEDDEEYELTLLKRIKQGEILNGSEIEELKMLRQIREQLDQNIEAIDTLHKGRDIDDNFDYKQYQRLMEQMKSGATLHENEFFELALLERMNRGEDLQEDEIEELKMLRQIREQLDQNAETLCQGKESGPDKCEKQLMEQMQTREADHELHTSVSFECTIQGKVRQDLESEDKKAVGQSRERDDQNKKDIHNLHRGADIKFNSDEDPRHELQNDEQHRQEADTYDRENEETDENNIINPEARGGELFDKEYQSECNPVDITEQGQEAEEEDDVEVEDKNNTAQSSEIRGKEVFEKEDLFQSKPVEKIPNSKTLHMEDQNEHTVSDDLDENSVLKIRGEDIDKDLLYELELLIRKRDGEQFSNSQNFELDVLRRMRRGEAPSGMQNVELFKRGRTETILDEDYLQDLLDRNSRGEPVNEDLQYEVKLLHRNLDGETLSEDELLELYFFERRIDGDILTQDDLDELDLLRRRRLNLNITDGQSDTVEMFTAEDEDSVYRRDLLERQKAGNRLSKIEFQWLQILMKKYRKEELLEDELDELRMMRNQRNETGSPEVEFVNTKRLLEEEVKKKAKRELKEKRRKEKEERREQRSKRIEQKQLAKKMRREKKKKREGDQGKRISESTRGAHSEKEDQPDVSSRLDTANTVQIIGSPSMQPPGSRGDDKAKPKRGVFGGVFGTNKKKDRKMQELEEAKRLQEELIKEQMKALALDNEVEELEREKVMQEQLIQETIERKIADASVGSSSWETDSIDKNMESEDDSSSLSSWGSSLSDSSSEPGEIFGSKEGLIIPKKINYEAGNEDEHGNQVEHHPKPKHLDSASSDIASFPIESSHESNELGKIPTHNALNSEQHLSTKTGKSGIPKNSGEEVKRSGDIKNRTKSFSLGAHLKRQKKKGGVRKTKYGDDVSLGTLQLSKVIKDDKSDRSRRVKIHPDFASKKQERPWTPAINPNTQGTSTKNEKPDSTSISDNLYQFSQSVVSRISEAEAEAEVEVEVESVTSFHSSNKEGDFINNVYNDIVQDSEIEKSPYESTSVTSLGEEAYDLDLQEYENIESRLADKLESKKAEFDTTWENIVADENVVAQINQRLRERQRLKENMKEKKKQEKKEEEESNGLQDTPRLFLFEGEKVDMKNKRRKKKKKKKTRKTQRKLDRTLTKEFRKAMEEIFDSDSDGSYHHKTLSGEDFDDDDDAIQDCHIDPTATRIQSYDDNQLYDDVSEKSVSENDGAAVDSDEESEKFDGGYLKRLQARSMPQQVKRMLSGRNLTNYKSTHSESSDDLSFSSDVEDKIYHSVRRKQKRKKDGELAIDDIDPAEIYAQELEKKNKKKAFTVAGLRKELEDDLKQQVKQQQQEQLKQLQNNNNVKIGVGGFNIKPMPLMKKSKVPKPKNDLNLSTGMRPASQRFFAPTTNDQVKRPPETIEEEEEDEEEEGAFLTGGFNSEDFDVKDSLKDNLISYRSKLAWKKNLGNAGSNLVSSLTGTIKNPFKAKKSPQIGGGVVGGGGLLSKEVGHNEDSYLNNNNTGLGGFQSDNNDDNNNRISVLKAIGKMNGKNLLTKFKLPGKKNNNFGGGLMMDDDYGDDNYGG